MITYESSLKTISSSEEVVFSLLNDFRNLEKARTKLEESGKVKGLELTQDTCTLIADMIGQLVFRIEEREPYNLIKYHLDNSMLKANAQVQLSKVSENETNLQLSLSADLPPMIKMMVGKKLDEGIEKLADGLALVLNNLAKDTL